MRFFLSYNSTIVFLNFDCNIFVKLISSPYILMENLSVNTIELLLIIFAEINQWRKYIFCPVLPPSHDHIFLHFLSHFGKKKREKNTFQAGIRTCALRIKRPIELPLDHESFLMCSGSLIL